MEEEIIETSVANCWRIDPGINVIIFKAGAEAELSDVEENFAALKELNKGEPSPLFLDITKLKYMDRDARTYSARKEATTDVQALAILIGSPVGKMLGGFFLGLNKPPYPTKLFTVKEEAIAWLKGFVE